MMGPLAPPFHLALILPGALPCCHAYGLSVLQCLGAGEGMGCRYFLVVSLLYRSHVRCCWEGRLCRHGNGAFTTSGTQVNPRPQKNVALDLQGAWRKKSVSKKCFYLREQVIRE